MPIHDLNIIESEIIKIEHDYINDFFVLIKFELKRELTTYVAAMQRYKEWSDFEIIAFGHTEKRVLLATLNIIHSKFYILNTRVNDFCRWNDPANERFYINPNGDSIPTIQTNFKSLKIEDNKVMLEY